MAIKDEATGGSLFVKYKNDRDDCGLLDEGEMVQISDNNKNLGRNKENLELEQKNKLNDQ